MSRQCGTRSGYRRHRENGETACTACKAANAKYAKARKLRVDAGYVTLIPSQKVLEHVQQLQASGMGWRTIADTAGVARSVVARLLRYDTSRPAQRLRVATVRKLMAVQPQPADGSFVNIVPTARRLQALIAIGYTQADLAARMGWTPQNINALVHGRRPNCTHGVAKTVSDLYEQLSANPGPSKRSRALAARNGWAPPLAWDDIDNLDETPTGAAVVPVRTSIDVKEVAWLMQSGETLEVIGKRLGVNPKSIERALYRKAAA